MPYGEVQRYAGIYGFQTTIADGASDILRKEAETLAPIIAQGEHFEKIPPDEYNDMMRSTATNYMDVTIMQQLFKALDQQYSDALKQ